MDNKQRLVFRFYGVNPNGELESPYVKTNRQHANEKNGYQEDVYYNFDPATGEEEEELSATHLVKPKHPGLSVIGLPTAKNSIFMGDELELYNKELADKFYKLFKEDNKDNKEFEGLTDDNMKEIFNEGLYAPYSDAEPDNIDNLIEYMMEDLANQAQWSSRDYFGDKPKYSPKNDRTKLYIAGIPEKDLIDNKEVIGKKWSVQRDSAPELWVRSLSPKDSLLYDVDEIIRKKPQLYKQALRRRAGFYDSKPDLKLARSLFENMDYKEAANEYFLPYIMYDILCSKGAKPSDAFFDVFDKGPHEFSDEQLKFIKDDMSKCYKQTMMKRNILNGLTKGDSKWR